ncbi:MAG: metallophosphoesterase family protein [Bacillota bacterium]|nr:metallophosphoesterase family protein [Bacillota bacterium]
MLRDFYRKHRWFTAVLIISGILTATLAGVLIFSTIEGVHFYSIYNQDDKAVHTSEAVKQQENEREAAELQVMLALGETRDEIVISWKGNEAGPSYFHYGRTPGEAAESALIKADRETASGGKYYRYSVSLENLKAGQEYYCEIGDGGSFQEIEKFQGTGTFQWAGTFRTPENRQETTFLYLGDVQAGNEYGKWGNALSTIYGRYPGIDFALSGGDLVDNGKSIKQWDSFFENAALFSRIPLMTVPGNHEGAGSNNTYKALFTLPENGPDIEGLKESFYYFDYGYCRFIMMDSSFLTDKRKAALGSEEWERCEDSIEGWLEKTLDESPKIWNIVVTHHPPYGLHDYNTVSPQLRKLWTPVMEKGDVDLVLSGHQHVYMRTRKINGITYITGNSGNMKSTYYTGYNAPLYAETVVDGGFNFQMITAGRRSLSVASLDKNGSVIDEAVIKKESRFHIFEFFSSNQVIIQSAQVDVVI